jgi:hypothetical protein
VLGVRAVVPRLAAGSVVGHVTAALLHGFDVWAVPLDRVHVTRIGSGASRGRTKYGRSLKPGQDPAEAVYREKLREDELRGEGLTVVRWTWGDLDVFGPIAARLRRAFTL